MQQPLEFEEDEEWYDASPHQILHPSGGHLNHGHRLGKAARVLSTKHKQHVVEYSAYAILNDVH